ncbi:MAG: hypothetical protein HUU08_02970 [Candidatus Brocadia sp.]|nr:hypothetical protein [Candidatus Brocadia sp.]
MLQIIYLINGNKITTKGIYIHGTAENRISTPLLIDCIGIFSLFNRVSGGLSDSDSTFSGNIIDGFVVKTSAFLVATS